VSTLGIAERAQSHAVLPAFVLGLAVASIFHHHRELQRRFRGVAFALLTPFFFLEGG
jgi:Kef-type K+ transport system membrane component KefB